MVCLCNHTRREVTAQIECDCCRAVSSCGQQILCAGPDARHLWAQVRNAALCLRGLLIWHGWAVVPTAGDDEPPIRDLCPACTAKLILSRSDAGGDPRP